MFDHNKKTTDEDISDASVQTLFRITNQQLAPTEREVQKRKNEQRKRRKKKKKREKGKNGDGGGGGDEDDEEFAKNFLPSVYQIHENIRMGPVAKWKKKRTIPWKIIVHTIIVILVTVLVWLFTQKRQPFFRRQGEGFAELFLPSSHKSIAESGFETYIAHLKNVDETLDDIQGTVLTYYRLSNTSVDSVMYLPKSRKEDDVIRPVRATIQILDHNPRDLLNTNDTSARNRANKYIQRTLKDELSEEAPLGTIIPKYMENGTRLFFDQFHDMELRFDFQSLDVSAYSTSNVAECIQWTVYKKYEFQGSGALATTLYYDYNECENMKPVRRHQFRKATTWVSLFLLIFSLISQFLTFKSIVKRVRYFLHLRKNTRIMKTRSMSGHNLKSMLTQLDLAQKIGLPLSEIRLGDLPQFVSAWYLVQWFADVCNITTFFLLVFDHIDAIYPPMFLGAGAFLSWVSILRFFQYAPSFYALIVTVKNSVPNAIRFIVCVMPVFIGFSIAGTTIFGHYNRNFDDLSEAAISLFCMMNGDAIHHIFDGLSGINLFMFFCSRIYVYIFCLLFITTIMNIFILIMQDSFEKTRQQFAEKKEAEKLLFGQSTSMLLDTADSSNNGKGNGDDDDSDDDSSDSSGSDDDDDESSDVRSYSSDDLDLEDNIALFDDDQQAANIMLQTPRTAAKAKTSPSVRSTPTQLLQQQMQQIANRQDESNGQQVRTLQFIFDEEPPLENIDRIMNFIRELHPQASANAPKSSSPSPPTSSSSSPSSSSSSLKGHEQPVNETAILLNRLTDIAQKLKQSVGNYREHTILGGHKIDDNYYAMMPRQEHRLSRQNTLYRTLKGRSSSADLHDGDE